MTAERLLGEDVLLAGSHFEDAAGGRDQTKGRDLLVLGLQDFFRHTDGMGKIASAAAVLDGDLHLLCHETPPSTLRLPNLVSLVND